MKIIFAITVSTEEEEIKRLVDFLIQHKHKEDDIVIQYDSTKASKEMVSMLEEYKIPLYGVIFRDNFADFKNELNKVCRDLGADYIYQLDADEMISEYMIKSLRGILELNSSLDLVWVPRINTVNGLTQEHINKWHWHVNDKGWVNFPDFQGRIFKSNMTWHGRVHERIIGGEKFATLPTDEIYCIQHHKSIERQETQNNFYNKI